MRAFKTSFLLLVVFILIAPSPAQAWWGWLDELSGPGRFWGAEFDFRLACLMQQAPWGDAIAESQVALGMVSSLHPPDTAPVGTIGSVYQELSTRLAQMLGTGESRLKKEIATPQGAIEMAGEMEPWLKRLEDLLHPQNATSIAGPTAIAPRLITRLSETDRVNVRAVQGALARAASSLRASAVPRVSKLPGGVAWSSCTDRSASGEPVSANAKIQHQDRHEVLSIVLNYREYWNSDYLNWGHATNDTYAGGEIIHLRIIEPKLSWPMSGSLDVLDGQAGMGLYSFSSKGLPGTRVGLIVEPIRFDLHFPSKLADSQRNFFARLPLALSFRAGVVLFPAGFAPDAFNAKGTAARRITGGEALFEYGIVVNVGRLFQ
jgi:hypothetical protein